MTAVIFRDFPGLEKSFRKFRDFPGCVGNPELFNACVKPTECCQCECDMERRIRELQTQWTCCWRCCPDVRDTWATARQDLYDQLYTCLSPDINNKSNVTTWDLYASIDNNNSSNTTKINYLNWRFDLSQRPSSEEAGTQFFRFLTRLNDDVSRKRS